MSASLSLPPDIPDAYRHQLTGRILLAAQRIKNMVNLWPWEIYPQHRPASLSTNTLEDLVAIFKLMGKTHAFTLQDVKDQLLQSMRSSGRRQLNRFDFATAKAHFKNLNAHRIESDGGKLEVLQQTEHIETIPPRSDSRTEINTVTRVRPSIPPNFANSPKRSCPGLQVEPSKQGAQDIAKEMDDTGQDKRDAENHRSTTSRVDLNKDANTSSALTPACQDQPEATQWFLRDLALKIHTLTQLSINAQQDLEGADINVSRSQHEIQEIQDGLELASASLDIARSRVHEAQKNADNLGRLESDLRQYLANKSSNTDTGTLTATQDHDLKAASEELEKAKTDLSPMEAAHSRQMTVMHEVRDSLKTMQLKQGELEARLKMLETVRREKQLLLLILEDSGKAFAFLEHHSPGLLASYEASGPSLSAAYTKYLPTAQGTTVGVEGTLGKRA